LCSFFLDNRINYLKVLSHLFEHFGVSAVVEVVGGVNDGNYDDFLVVDDGWVDFAAQLGDAGFVKNSVCCEVADGNDDFRLHDGNELVEAFFAVVDFFFFGVAVVFGVAEDGVGDEDVFASEVDGCKKFLENFSGGAAEWDA